MRDDTRSALDDVLASGDPSDAFEFLIQHFREVRDARSLFQTRLMQRRLALGLPVIQSGLQVDGPKETRDAYEQAIIGAAREAGELSLEDGKIAQAWSYFRAIGERAPVAAAIERLGPGDNVEEAIAVAFQEGVHPAKGLELIIDQYGMCRAITAFGMQAVRDGRSECMALLVRKLHEELVDRIRNTISANEGAPPESGSLPELIGGRDWLFGEYDYYIDTSHLHSLLPFSLETRDRETLTLLRELCHYGKRLSPMFQSRGQPPFENPFTDYDEYLAAVLGDDVDRRVAHFRTKVQQMNPEEVGVAPAEVIVNLLVDLGRYTEALDVALTSLAGVDTSELACPSVAELCARSNDWDRLRMVSSGTGDLLNYVAASVMRARPSA